MQRISSDNTYKKAANRRSLRKCLFRRSSQPSCWLRSVGPRQEKPAEHVDHDHDTGVVRGILCFTCNVALGNIKDRRDLLLGLVDYLEAHAPEVAAARDLASHRLSVVLPVEPGPVSARIGQRVQVAPMVWRLTVAA